MLDFGLFHLLDYNISISRVDIDRIGTMKCRLWHPKERGEKLKNKRATHGVQTDPVGTVFDNSASLILSAW